MAEEATTSPSTTSTPQLPSAAPAGFGSSNAERSSAPPEDSKNAQATSSSSQPTSGSTPRSWSRIGIESAVTAAAGGVGMFVGGPIGGAVLSGVTTLGMSIWRQWDNGINWWDVAGEVGISAVGGLIGGGLVSGARGLTKTAFKESVGEFWGHLGAKGIGYAITNRAAIINGLHAGAGQWSNLVPGVTAGLGNFLFQAYRKSNEAPERMPTLVLGESVRDEELLSPKFSKGRGEIHEGISELRYPNEKDALYPPEARYRIDPKVQDWFVQKMARDYIAPLYASMGNPPPPPLKALG